MSKKIQTMPDELKNLIKQGEGYTVEFKKSTASVSKDVYETVCSFSNREGGYIFIGVDDDGTVSGIPEDQVEALKKGITASAYDKSKIFPAVALQPEDYVIDGKAVVCVYVPMGENVLICDGHIYERRDAADVEITKNQFEVFRLYSRKQRDAHYEDTVFPRYSASDLRPDLIARARKSATIRDKNHPWKDMTDEELLRSCSLIMEDPETHKEGITLAAILLFGTDRLIGAKFSYYMTDAIFRIYNVDRYDDREVVTTNLLDSYDRLIAFGERHLNDLFTLDGCMRVSSRNHILHEIVSNLLMHRDFSSPYPSRMFIERDCIRTENPNRFNGHGDIDSEAFEPCSKNPHIEHVFREMGLTGEPGSGVRNTCKYSMLYSGAVPSFTEGDMFVTTVPLTEAATYIAGPRRRVRYESSVLSERDKYVLDRISENPHINREDLMKTSGIRKWALDTSIKKLKDEHMLERAGSKKNGYWKVTRQYTDDDQIQRQATREFL